MIVISSDNEVVDREIIHTQAESDRNARIKDTMREHCVVDLTNSWYDILVSQPLLLMSTGVWLFRYW